MQIHPGDSVSIAIDGMGGTSCPWLLSRRALVWLLEICDGELPKP